jgi:hypothetical protein
MGYVQSPTAGLTPPSLVAPPAATQPAAAAPLSPADAAALATWQSQEACRQWFIQLAAPAMSLVMANIQAYPAYPLTPNQRPTVGPEPAYPWAPGALAPVANPGLAFAGGIAGGSLQNLYTGGQPFLPTVASNPSTVPATLIGNVFTAANFQQSVYSQRLSAATLNYNLAGYPLSQVNNLEDGISAIQIYVQTACPKPPPVPSAPVTPSSSPPSTSGSSNTD